MRAALLRAAVALPARARPDTRRPHRRTRPCRAPTALGSDREDPADQIIFHFSESGRGELRRRSASTTATARESRPATPFTRQAGVRPRDAPEGRHAEGHLHRHLPRDLRRRPSGLRRARVLDRKAGATGASVSQLLAQRSTAGKRHAGRVRRRAGPAVRRRSRSRSAPSSSCSRSGSRRSRRSPARTDAGSWPRSGSRSRLRTLLDRDRHRRREQRARDRASRARRRPASRSGRRSTRTDRARTCSTRASGTVWGIRMLVWLGSRGGPARLRSPQPPARAAAGLGGRHRPGAAAAVRAALACAARPAARLPRDLARRSPATRA